MIATFSTTQPVQKEICVHLDMNHRPLTRREFVIFGCKEIAENSTAASGISFHKYHTIFDK
jgi:hypothetical protein